MERPYVFPIGRPGRRLGSVLSFLLCFSLIAGVAPAAGAPRIVVHHPRYSVNMFALASNGYSIAASGLPRGEATVLASIGPDQVRYELPAVVTENELEAHFGDVIDIAAQFVPGPRHRRLPVPPNQHCTGRRPEIRYGEFVGTIEFHGELGYTELATSHVDAISERYFRQVCRRLPRAAASSTGPPARQLIATRPEAGGETRFSALTGIAHPKTYPQWIFEAKRAETVGPVKIARQVLVEAQTGGALSAPGVTPVTAGISPPAPFFGGAEYREGAAGAAGTWAGTLGVDFPGLAPTALTGEGFTTRTCVGCGPPA